MHLDAEIRQKVQQKHALSRQDQSTLEDYSALDSACAIVNCKDL